MILSYNKIDISVKRDTCVLLGVKWLTRFCIACKHGHIGQYLAKNSILKLSRDDGEKFL